MQTIKLKQIPEKEIIKKAADVLNKDGVIIYPTETCYGIGVDATNPKAVQKLLNYKGFRKGKPISIAVSDKQMAKNYVEFNKTAENLYNNFLPGPITVISMGKHKVDSKLESEKGTLGVRIPDYELTRKIIRKFGKPITATSANISNKKTPYKIEDIRKFLNSEKEKLIDLIIDAGELPKRKPSTVVSTTKEDLEIIRKGKIKFSNLNSGISTSRSNKETQNIANSLIKDHFKYLNKDKCLIYALQGELGAGKTEFCKGIAKALNIKSTIKSPSYVLVREYNYSLNKKSGVFFHIDTWRMESPQELENLGFKKMLKPGNVIAVEWIEKAKYLVDQYKSNPNIKIIWISIQYTDNKNVRQIEVSHE